MKRTIAVRAIIIQSGKLFCVRQKHYEGGMLSEESSWWCTPGGVVENGEALIPALEREIVEELGIRPNIGNLLYIQQFTHGGTERLEFFFHVSNANDFEHIDLTQTTHGQKEIADYGFVAPTSTEILPSFLTQQDYSAIDGTAATQIFSIL